MIIDPKTKDKSSNYKLLIGSCLPRPIAFVTSLSEAGVVNAAPFSFYSIVCVNPPMISITCSRKTNENLKDTAANILANKEFVVQAVDADNVAKINETAIEFPSDVSEVESVGLNMVPSSIVSVPRIQECKVHFECKLERHIELGGWPGSPDCDLLIGEIIMIHVDDSIYDPESGRIDTALLNPIGRLAGTEYVKLGERFSMPRTKYEEYLSKD